MEWIKANISPLKNDLYHCNIRMKDSELDTFPQAVNFIGGEWEIGKDYEVVQWLSESPIVSLSPVDVRIAAEKYMKEHTHAFGKHLGMKEQSIMLNAFYAGHAHRLPEIASDEVREDIENILYSIQNKEGNSHLFTTELCSEAADEIIKSIQGHAIKLEENKGQQGEQSLKGSVSEVLKESGGLWQACTGCHETVDGQETGHYPYNDTFQSYQGSGCHECGGIGVVWNDYSDYEQKISPTPSLPLSIVEALEKANPYVKHASSSALNDSEIWTECCSKLRELIATCAKNAQVQSLPVSIVEQLEKEIRLCFIDACNAYREDENRETIPAKGFHEISKVVAKEVCSKLRELISSTPIDIKT